MKDISDLLGRMKSRNIILIFDYYHYSDDTEYLKELVKKEESSNMMKLITEYYKYHGDIPRLFLKSVERIVTKFFDK